MPARDRATGALAPLLAIFGSGQLVLGGLLWLAPGTFYDRIGPYGPRNDHYMADLATFYLALGVAALIAARRPAWRVPVIGLALIQYAFHSLNHLLDMGAAEPEWLGPANLASLGATTLLLAWMLSVALRSERR